MERFGRDPLYLGICVANVRRYTPHLNPCGAWQPEYGTPQVFPIQRKVKGEGILSESPPLAWAFDDVKA